MTIKMKKLLKTLWPCLMVIALLFAACDTTTSDTTPQGGQTKEQIKEAKAAEALAALTALGVTATRTGDTITITSTGEVTLDSSLEIPAGITLVASGNLAVDGAKINGPVVAAKDSTVTITKMAAGSTGTISGKANYVFPEGDLGVLDGVKINVAKGATVDTGKKDESGNQILFIGPVPGDTDPATEFVLPATAEVSIAKTGLTIAKGTVSVNAEVELDPGFGITVDANATLAIPPETALTIPKSSTMDITGTVTVGTSSAVGTLNVDGTIDVAKGGKLTYPKSGDSGGTAGLLTGTVHVKEGGALIDANKYGSMWKTDATDKSGQIIIDADADTGPGLLSDTFQIVKGSIVLLYPDGEPTQVGQTSPVRYVVTEGSEVKILLTGDKLLYIIRMITGDDTINTFAKAKGSTKIDKAFTIKAIAADGAISESNSVFYVLPGCFGSLKMYESHTSIFYWLGGLDLAPAAFKPKG